MFERVIDVLAAGGKIYIHCSAGLHRTGMITHALLRYLGWSRHDAVEKLRELRALTAKEVRAFEVAPVVLRRWERHYDDYIAAVRKLVSARTWLAAAGAISTGVLFLATFLFLVWRLRSGAIDAPSARERARS